MVSKPNKQMTDTDHLIALRATHIELKRDYAALEKRCEEAERERDKVRNIVKLLEERLRHYYKVMEKRYNRIEDLESENAMLRKQVEQKLKIEQLDCLRRIRDAVGDNGKMMQDELVDHIADLSKMVETLRKRMEPIESAHREYKNYPSSAIVKRDAYDKAISKCMELKEGE